MKLSEEIIREVYLEDERTADAIDNIKFRFKFWSWYYDAVDNLNNEFSSQQGSRLAILDKVLSMVKKWQDETAQKIVNLGHQVPDYKKDLKFLKDRKTIDVKLLWESKAASDWVDENIYVDSNWEAGVKALTLINNTVNAAETLLATEESTSDEDADVRGGKLWNECYDILAKYIMSMVKWSFDETKNWIKKS
jgi:hypothetical protein